MRVPSPVCLPEKSYLLHRQNQHSVRICSFFTIVFLYKASKQEFVIFRVLIKIELSWNQEDFLAENF